MTDQEKDQQQEQEEESQQEEPQEQEADGHEQEEDVKDKHGQPGINKERHEKEMAAKDAEIKALQEKLDEQSKTEEGRGELRKELDQLKADMEDERLTYKLELAGCKNPKAAKALLGDYDNDVAKLKEGESYLFGKDKKTGSTGFKPEGATSDIDARRAKAREAAGLPPKKE